MFGSLETIVKKGRNAIAKYFQIPPRIYEIDNPYPVVFE